MFGRRKNVAMNSMIFCVTMTLMCAAAAVGNAFAGDYVFTVILVVMSAVWIFRIRTLVKRRD